MNIEQIPSADLPRSTFAEVLALCEAAYEEDLATVFSDVGPGLHLLGRVDGRLVSHVLVVTRWLQPEGLPPLRTAYVELVATHPSAQGRGHASTLMRALPPLLGEFEIGGLSPSDAGFYARLGWELWAGPLTVRTARGVEPTPGEELMVLRLPTTPRALDLSRGASIEWRPGEVW